MSTSAWIFMLSAWVIIIAMTVYCFTRLLRSQNSLHEDEELAGDRPEPWGAPPAFHDD